jgi:phosphate transport system ATP-binding protein
MIATLEGAFTQNIQDRQTTTGAQPTADLAPPGEVAIQVRNLNFFYGRHQVLFDNTIDIHRHRITAIIGPSGCGKSTHIRAYNRIYELYRDQRAAGEILLNGENVLAPGIDLTRLRARVGMIFQRPTPFPMTIFDNIAYGLRVNTTIRGTELAGRIEDTLKRVALWDEVKDKLQESGTALSGGQQQRLCIARAIAIQPEVLLMDEPCSAIDPIATAHIEELMRQLKEDYTIVLVTHSMQQAARVSDFTAFFYMGKLVEFGLTKQIFTKPRHRQTEDYITGRFG